tara:strand:- start:2 stop:205 length:204 start_codon:yes stop_codon:yes gene_type:complete
MKVKKETIIKQDKQKNYFLDVSLSSGEIKKLKKNKILKISYDNIRICIDYDKTLKDNVTLKEFYNFK